MVIDGLATTKIFFVKIYTKKKRQKFCEPAIYRSQR